MPWLVVSIVLSVALTLALNLWLRMFPQAGRRMERRVIELSAPRPADGSRSSNRRIRVWAPWKAMLLASLVLTVLVNILLWVWPT